MKKYLKYIWTFSMIVALLQLSILYANPENSKIEGKVIDAQTKEPLIGVNVIVEHSTIGAATDKNGEYRIPKVRKGQIRLVASMIGYKPEHKIINVKSDQMVTVNFELETTALEMGAVVVTGTATPHLVEDTPVRTEVISRVIIEQKQSCNLAEALSFHTGIRVENNCQNCNFTQVRILGMDGKYSQILIDGDPVVSSLAGVYGLEHFPEEMVDHIEIVKGGGSSLYGGGAVAGVINIITRRPLINQVRIKYLGNILNGKVNQHVGGVAEKVNETGISGAYVFGSFRIRNPYDHNHDGFSELGEICSESIGFKWYYQPFESAELLTSFHRIHEERRGGNKFEKPVHEAEIAEWIEHWRSGGTIRWSQRPGPLFDYRMYYSFSVENRKSYYGGLDGDTPEDRLEALAFYGKTDNPLHIGGFQANYRVASHLLTAGLQYSRDKLNDKTTAETAYHIDEVYSNTGIFLQDNLHFGTEDEIEFVVGFRLDKHSELSNWIISPRMNAKFDIGGDFMLRGAYTTGFKPPQTYDEDLHLCGIEGDQRVIRNSPDLKEEKSYTISAGLEYQGYLNSIPAMASFTVFRIRLNDSFSEQFVSKQGNIERWERINSDGAKVGGIEFDLGIRPISDIEFRGGFTYKKSKFDSPHEDFNTRNFLRTPDLTGNVRIVFTPMEKLNFYLRSNYIGKADIPHEIAIEGQEDPELRLEKSEDFLQVDIGLSYRLPLNNGMNTKLNIGVRNLTNAFQKDLDKGPDRDPAYIYGPVQPRTIYLGFGMDF